MPLPSAPKTPTHFLYDLDSQMPTEGGQGKKIENSKLIKREVVPDLQGVLNMLAFPTFPSSAWMDGSEDIYQSPHRERSINICRVKVLWSPRLVASLCSSGKPPEIRGLRAQLNFLPGASLFSSFFLRMRLGSLELFPKTLKIPHLIVTPLTIFSCLLSWPGCHVDDLIQLCLRP